ncbi:hypothetical protein GCM10027565_23590 [Bordetella tumulicola]
MNLCMILEISTLCILVPGLAASSSLERLDFEVMPGCDDTYLVPNKNATNTATYGAFAIISI